MSVLFGPVRPPVEKRHADVGAFTNLIPRNSQLLGTTPEWSLQKVAVWSCVCLTATIAECMPVEVFDSDGPDKKRMKMPSWLADLGGDGQGLPDWLFQAVWSWMLRGNVYGVQPAGMVDARMGTPTMIQLQHPDSVAVVEPFDTSKPPQWRVMGKELAAGQQMWHRRVFPVPGRLQGASPIETAAGTISLAVETTKFGLMWFHDGAHPSGILSNEGKISQEATKTAKERFMSALRGSREPVVLSGGWKYQPVQISPSESQFLETQGFTSAECCRLFGPGYAQIFGYETGESLTYANVEQRSLDLLMYAVDPWLVRLERALSRLLPADRHLKFNRGGLLRSDLLTRYQAHEIAIRNRLKTVNEVRAIEDLPPVSWGEEPPQALAAPPVPAKVED